MQRLRGTAALHIGHELFHPPDRREKAGMGLQEQAGVPATAGEEQEGERLITLLLFLAKRRKCRAVPEAAASPGNAEENVPMPVRKEKIGDLREMPESRQRQEAPQVQEKGLRALQPPGQAGGMGGSSPPALYLRCPLLTGACGAGHLPSRAA